MVLKTYSPPGFLSNFSILQGTRSRNWSFKYHFKNRLMSSTIVSTKTILHFPNSPLDDTSGRTYIRASSVVRIDFQPTRFACLKHLDTSSNTYTRVYRQRESKASLRGGGLFVHDARTHVVVN